jgi:hypothetical protein
MVEHIIKLPIRRGYGLEVHWTEDGDFEAEIPDQVEEPPVDAHCSVDPSQPLAFWQKAQSWGTGHYRLYQHCLDLQKQDGKDLLEGWENTVMADEKILAHGWPRDEPHRRNQYAQFLIKALKEEKTSQYICSKKHNL